MQNGSQLVEKPKTGRPTAFCDATAKKIIEACGSGFTMEKAAELVGLNPGTVANWVYKRPVFGEEIKKARKAHELSLLKSIEEAGAKSWQAKAWLAERVYQYSVPSSRLEVAGAIAHGATPQLAQMLAGLNIKPTPLGDDSVTIQAQTVDHQPKRLSDSRRQTDKVKKVRRYSKRPTRPRPTGTPPPASATHIPPLQISAKNKKALDATTTETNNEGQEGAQQAA